MPKVRESAAKISSNRPSGGFARRRRALLDDDLSEGESDLSEVGFEF